MSTNRRQYLASQRRGMALPVVIVVLLVLGASLAGGVMLARGERVIDDAGKTQVLAKSYAETGLDRVLADRASLGLSGQPGASDSTRVTVSGVGYYDLITTRLRTAVGSAVPGLYLVRSHATITRSGTVSSPNGEYTVTRLGVWQNGSVSVSGAYTSLTGINLSDDATIFNGNDMCVPASTAVPGINVPTVPGVFGGHTGVVSGSTGATPSHSIGATTVAAATAMLPSINWPHVIDSTAITPTLTVPPGTWPTAAQWADTNFVPVIMIKNGPSPYGSSPLTNTEWTLPSNGRGLLIVQGNLGLHQGRTWSGLVLVGGIITSDNADRLYGASVSGLNAQLGLPVTASSVGNGTWGFRYNSCSVAMALRNSGVLRGYGNTWSSTFKVY